LPFNHICFKKYFNPKKSQDFKAQNSEKSFEFVWEVLWIPAQFSINCWFQNRVLIKFSGSQPFQKNLVAYLRLHFFAKGIVKSLFLQIVPKTSSKNKQKNYVSLKYILTEQLKEINGTRLRNTGQDDRSWIALFTMPKDWLNQPVL